MMVRYREVWLIDDDKTAAFGFSRIVTNKDFAEHVKVYRNAAEALKDLNKIAKEPGHYAFPDVVFLDLNMPGMGGVEFLDLLGEMQTPENFKLYVLTAAQDQSLKNHVLSQKVVTGCLAKPITSKGIMEL